MAPRRRAAVADNSQGGQDAIPVDDLLHSYDSLAMARSKPQPIYNRVPVLRAERGLSRKDLAALVGVNFQTIGYLERGDYQPSLDLAFRLSEYFGLPIEAIFSRAPLEPMSAALFASARAAPDPGAPR